MRHPNASLAQEAWDSVFQDIINEPKTHNEKYMAGMLQEIIEAVGPHPAVRAILDRRTLQALEERDGTR